MEDYSREDKGIFVEENDPYGTILISTGAVLGKLEHMAGGISGKWLKEPLHNPLKSEATEVREVVAKNLSDVFQRYPFPRTFPVLILACSDDAVRSYMWPVLKRTRSVHDVVMSRGKPMPHQSGANCGERRVLSA